MPALLLSPPSHKSPKTPAGRPPRAWSPSALNSMNNFVEWLQGVALLPRPCHPVVHPAPDPAEAAAAQGQGQAVAAAQGQEAAPAAAVAAQGEGQEAAPAAVEVEQAVNADGDAPPPGVLMVDLLGAPGTRWGLGTRLAQAVFAAAAVGFMASTDDFPTVTPFRFLVAAATLQCMWSLSLVAVDIYALLVKRSFRAPRATVIYSVGDWVMGVLTLAAASGSASISMLINDDLRVCSVNHCPRFMAATAMIFFSWFAIAPSCFFNLMTTFYRLQRA